MTDDSRYRADILADSIGPHGHRLTTFEVSFPQMVLRDLTRHRALSYSFESTRAVPVEARIAAVRNHPFVPIMRERVKGMARGRPLKGMERYRAEADWLTAARHAADQAEALLDVEKGIAGRLLEPFSFITGIISGTEWHNFFTLRCAESAQHELQVLAEMMRDARAGSDPAVLGYGGWHLPLVTASDALVARVDVSDTMFLPKVSAGRCASVSYLKHHANQVAGEAYQRWEERLAPSAHWSPGEHPAKCVREYDPAHFVCGTGNFTGWLQLRKHYYGESGA